MILLKKWFSFWYKKKKKPNINRYKNREIYLVPFVNAIKTWQLQKEISKWNVQDISTLEKQYSCFIYLLVYWILEKKPGICSKLAFETRWFNVRQLRWINAKVWLHVKVEAMLKMYRCFNVKRKVVSTYNWCWKCFNVTLKVSQNLVTFCKKLH